MSKIFNQIQVQKPRRNKFDLTHEKKLSLQMGALVPIFWKETMPGDNFRINTELFLRLAPMLAPIMHRVNVTTHFYKVPIRLVYNEWQDFITGGEDGESTAVPPFFRMNSTNMGDFPSYVQPGSLLDYMGVPVQNYNLGVNVVDAEINMIPFRAYQLIYNEYYRDQNIQPEIEFDLGGGEINDLTQWQNVLQLRYSCWEKDYKTTALPWPQRGPEMLMPMTFSVDEVYRTATGATNTTVGAVTTDNAGHLLNSTPVGIGLRGDNASTTINDLRTAIKIQEWLEKNARGGSRYIEQILHHFGVISSDARLQRPEYLGGSRQAVKISEVLSTVEGTEPQGNMAGHGVSAGTNGTINCYSEEHCIIMGIMRVLPRTAYYDGIDRTLLHRPSKFSYPWPELAHLGEQEVGFREVYWANDMTTPSASLETFGYQSRYAEYKYAEDSVHGDFRTTLDYWHMGRKLPVGTPALNSDFVTANPTHRIFAVTDETIHKVYAQVLHHTSAIRPLPYFGTPRF